jgi:16S rRNA G527 N7-methylase RsmG
MTDDTRLLTALAVIQARGAIGERSLAAAVAHADRFVDLIPSTSRSVVDLGSGGGLPGLVVAWRCPAVTVTLVERRATRADLLRRATISLGLANRTRVLDVDVSMVCEDSPRAFDVVTARSFGDVTTTAGFIDQLLAVGGVALVSEPPADRSDLWTSVLAAFPELCDGGVDQGIRVLTRS